MPLKKKEINLENISETDNIDPFVEDAPKSYDDFVQEIKMMLKNLKNNHNNYDKVPH